MRSRATVQSPAGYDSQNLTAAKLGVRLAAGANAALRANIRAAIQDSGYRYIIHPAETELGLVEADLTFGFDPGDIRRYGAVGDDATDNAAAIQMAIDVAEVEEIGTGYVYVPEGIFRFASKLEFTAPTVDARSLVLHGASCDRSILRKAFIGIGIEISNFARPSCVNFTLDRATGVVDTGVGILVTKAANQWVMRNVVVTGQGSHGVELIEANLCTIQDVLALSNGGDGVKLNGAATPDVNACTLINIDARGNTGWGVNFANAWANFGFGITAQSNTAGGVRIDNARQNSLHIYSESNTGPQISLIDNAECKGNLLTVLEGTVTYGGTTAARNTVIHTKRGPTFDTNFSKVTTNKLILPNELQDGTGVVGTLTVDHTADNRYDRTASGGGAVALEYLSNAAGTFDQTLTGRRYFGTPTDIGNGVAPSDSYGTGSPEGVVAAMVGSTFRRTDGGAGTSLYVKQSGGGGTTGWVGK